jgi:hypothetical protein
MQKKFTNHCFKCKRRFYTFEELDTDKPTCNRCFGFLVNKVRTPRQYYKFMDPTGPCPDEVCKHKIGEHD